MNLQTFKKKYKNREYQTGVYTSVNENGENLIIMILDTAGFIISTVQKNGWIRVNEYDGFGILVSETYEK